MDLTVAASTTSGLQLGVDAAAVFTLKVALLQCKLIFISMWDNFTGNLRETHC